LHPLLSQAIKPGPTSLAETSIEIMVVNDLADLDPGQRELSGFCARLGLDAATINRVEVIFEELASNAIRHGFNPGSGQSVRVRARAQADGIELVFEDDGVAFNPLELAAPKPFGAIEDAKIGGLGVAMVLKLATSFRYQAPAVRPGARRFSPRNRVTLTVSKARQP
jgi:anti-sigma regulatory factor (Ser/Thr protein kinase)